MKNISLGQLVPHKTTGNLIQDGCRGGHIEYPTAIISYESLYSQGVNQKEEHENI